MTIARIEVTRGDLTEYPLAEKVRGGWQNGVTFYPDETVTKVTQLRVIALDAAGSDAAEQAREALEMTKKGDFIEALDWVDVLAIRLQALLDERAEFEDMAWRLSCLLDEQTGGLLSKTNYPVSVMSQHIDEHHDRMRNEYRADVAAEEQ